MDVDENEEVGEIDVDEEDDDEEQDRDKVNGASQIVSISGGVSNVVHNS